MNSDSSCNWMGTLNNPLTHYPMVDSAEHVLRMLHETKNATFTCGQLERGENGTEHLQFYINVGKNKCRLSALKKLCPHTHWEVVKVNKAA